MTVALRFELEGIRDKLERGDPESVAISLSIVDGLLAGIEDEPEEHRRRLLKEISDLDVALAVVDAKAEREGGEWVVFYRLPCGPWHRVLALRQNIVALAGAIKEGKPTIPCPTCHRWTAVPDNEGGTVAMRCADGHEWELSVISFSGDMRGEKALGMLPARSEPEASA